MTCATLEHEPGTVSLNLFLRSVRPASLNLTFFQTRICDFLRPFSDLNQNIFPVFGPKSQKLIPSFGKSYPIGEVPCWLVLSADDSLVRENGDNARADFKN